MTLAVLAPVANAITSAQMSDRAASWIIALTTQPSPAATPSSATPGQSGAPHVLPDHGCLAAADTSTGLGDFTWANVVTIGAALLAASGVILTLLVNASRSRRDSLTTLYADALGAVAEYLEGPYRILRKDGEKSTRFALTSKMSDVKAAVDHNQALLKLHSSAGVADAFDAYVSAAKAEAGKQMHEAWKVPPVTTDEGVNLKVALPRGNSEAARDRLVEVMQADLARRWYKTKSRSRFNTAVAAVQMANADADE